jgi:hypothetical protein
MSEVRAVALAQPSKLSAYITLTKPDVSFLVLMTTGAGYYMGVRGPIGWLHMIHVIVATMMIAAGTAALNHYIERESDRYMRRTASRPLPTGVLTPAEALRFGIILSIAGAVDLYLTAGFWPCFLAAEKTHGLGHLCRGHSWCYPADDWLDRRHRQIGCRRVAALRHPVCLAIPTLSRHRLDVPRRLRPRRHPNASGSG